MSIRKMIFAVLLIAFVMTGLAACGGSSASKQEAAETAVQSAKAET